MLVLETSIQQLLKVELKSFAINDLVSGLPELGRTHPGAAARKSRGWRIPRSIG